MASHYSPTRHWSFANDSRDALGFMERGVVNPVGCSERRKRILELGNIGDRQELLDCANIIIDCDRGTAEQADGGLTKTASCFTGSVEAANRASGQERPELQLVFLLLHA
nr:hypothetical protein Iba_chr15eCG7040 [Ipomoea batatas]